MVEVNLEAESEGEQGDVEPGHGESEGEREQSSQEGAVAEPAEESEEEEEEGDEERVAATLRRDVVESGSERSGERRYESEDEEVDQTRIQRSPSEEKEEAPVPQSDVNIRNVFGSSDDEDAEEYVRNDIEPDEPVSFCFPFQKQYDFALIYAEMLECFRDRQWKMKRALRRIRDQTI